jgi:hypothetical protein
MTKCAFMKMLREFNSPTHYGKRRVKMKQQIYAAIAVGMCLLAPSAFAQGSFAFSGAETAGLSNYLNGTPVYSTYSGSNRSGLYDYIETPREQTYWPSAAAMGNSH